VVLGIARDITKRKQALEALQESRQLLANIINFLPDATFVIDKKGRVIAWNQAMEEMSGVSAADMLGKGDYEYAMCFYGERRPTLIDLVLDPGGEVEANYLSLTRKGDVLCGEAYHQGYKRYFYGKASVLFDSKGNVAGAIESIQDITERRLMMEGPEGHLHRLQVKSGLSGFHESEVLEFLLTYAISGKDVRTIAKDLLNEFGNNLASVFDAPVEALQRVEGIQERAAVLIGLMPHLFDCYQSCRWVRPETFASTDAVVSYLRALLGTRRNETFCVLALDSQNRLIAVEQVHRGSINRTAVFPRLVVETCLKHRATAVILAHNHPGGSPLPSVADRQLTKRLKNILSDLDIVVHDHIIIAGLDQYFSFAETGGLNECSIGCGEILGDDKKRF
jgi:DNA repair protein RadC